MSTKQMILLPILIAFTCISAFADENLTILTDSEQYHTGETLTVSGTILEKKMPVIAMRVYDPDGVIISANSVEIDQFNTFSREISLDSPFFDKSGIYLLKFDYGKIKAETTFEVIGNQTANGSSANTEISTKIIPEILSLDTDKSTYRDGDFITITGTVSAIGDPSVLIGIYDSFGTPTGFYFGDVNSNLGFSASFLAKGGVNFKTQGAYTVKAHYGESKRESSFEFKDVIEQPKNLNQPTEKKPEIKLVPKTAPIKPESPLIVPASQIPEKIKSEMVKTQEPVQDNLTVKDIELGKMLNQMTLNCDTSEYTDSISYYDGMGPALMRLCKYDSAIAYFDNSLEKNPDDIQVLTNKGSALVKLGQYSEAITYYDLALGIKPDYLPAINNKANALADIGDYKAAILLYDTVLDKEPRYTAAQNNLEKAKEKLLVFTKNQEQKSVENPVIQTFEEPIKVAEKIQKEEKPANILEQIGNMFSFLSTNVFGFMK